MSTPRPIDHAVLATADLATARARLTSLGFTVAPEGRHPFGTENACVYLADGTFLEPLAVADQEAVHRAASEGNVFVGHDAVFRTRIGQEGFSALVFGTPDAVADDTAFRALGVSAGKPLQFSRPFVGGDGRSDIASFRLAFAGDLRAPDALFFTCERVNAPAVDRGPLTRHANGAERITRVILSAPEPEHFRVLLEHVIGAAATDAAPDRVEIEAANALVAVLSGEALETWLGIPPASSFDRSLLQLVAIAFGVADLDAISALLDRNDIAVVRSGDRLVVAPAPGQGATLVFENSYFAASNP